MVDPLQPAVNFLTGVLYPLSGPIMIVIAVLLSFWLILHVETADRFSLQKSIPVILAIAFFAGFGVHIMLFFLMI